MRRTKRFQKWLNAPVHANATTLENYSSADQQLQKKYPSPAYIRGGRMFARDEVSAVSGIPCVMPAVKCKDTELKESLLRANNGDQDAELDASNRSPTPRSPSDNPHKDLMNSLRIVDESKNPKKTGPSQTTDLKDSPGASATTPNLPQLLSQPIIVPPDRTWHSAAAAMEAMLFAERFAIDVLYVIHYYAVPTPRFHVASAATPPTTSFRRRLLASSGLYRLACPLQLPLHENHLEDGHSVCLPENPGPSDMAYGQIFNFYQSRSRWSGNGQQDQLKIGGRKGRVNRAIVLAAYRMEQSVGTLTEKDAKSFVEFLIDLNVANGTNCLFLSPRPAGTEALSVTAGIKSSRYQNVVE